MSKWHEIATPPSELTHVFEFDSPGVYEISLVAIGPGGRDETATVRRITVTAPEEPMSDTLQLGQALAPDQQLISRNGRCRLLNQRDGNLVIYQDETPRWSSGTTTDQPGNLVLQGDGNLVLYDAAGQPLWATDTSTGRRLRLRDDGVLELIGATWSSTGDLSPIPDPQ